jgi:hypothetical protein
MIQEVVCKRRIFVSTSLILAQTHYAKLTEDKLVPSDNIAKLIAIMLGVEAYMLECLRHVQWQRRGNIDIPGFGVLKG